MSKLVLVSPEGRIIGAEKPTGVEEHQEDPPLHVIAAQQHAKDSTKADTNKPHSFTLHDTYTGEGCAVCGKGASAHS